MQFHDLARYFETLETTTARLKMYRDLGQLFQKASRADIAKIAYLCQARLLPPFTGVDLGMGEKTVASALALASGATHQKIAR